LAGPSDGRLPGFKDGRCEGLGWEVDAPGSAMPGQFLTTTERERWDRFPPEIVEEDLVSFFTLSAADLVHIPVKSAAHNRLGFALQLCAIRYLGFCPADLATAPTPAVTYLARQVDADPRELSRYGARAHTRTDHLQKILDYLGFRKAKPRHLKALQSWLAERALEHDRPTFLLQMACEKLYRDKLVRPGITILERMVTRGRIQAQQDTFRLLSPARSEHINPYGKYHFEMDGVFRGNRLRPLRQP
jgi:hypothetical protein